MDFYHELIEVRLKFWRKATLSDDFMSQESSSRNLYWRFFGDARLRSG